MPQRRACRIFAQARSTQRYLPKLPQDEQQLREAVVGLALQYGRYGYRPVCGLLRNQGWRINHKRVERIWREEGLKVPRKQPPRRRLWLNDGCCIRLRPMQRNHVWSYDFVSHRTHDGRAFRLLTVLDEYTRECLAIKVERRLKSQDVIELLGRLFLVHGLPQYIRSDNGPEFTARAARQWLEQLSVGTLYIEPGSPWENGYIESFNGKLRFELLDVEIFDTLLEAQVLVEQWRRHYNQVRPHSALGYRPPAPEAMPLLPLKPLHPIIPMPKEAATLSHELVQS